MASHMCRHIRISNFRDYNVTTSTDLHNDESLLCNLNVKKRRKVGIVLLYVLHTNLGSC